MIIFAEGIRLLLNGCAPDGSPVATYREDRQRAGRANDSYYDPCNTGLHLCGATDDEMQLTTVGNWKLSRSEALTAFDWFKDQIEEPAGSDFDFILDLQLEGDCEATLACTRQQLVALQNRCEAEGI